MILSSFTSTLAWFKSLPGGEITEFIIVFALLSAIFQTILMITIRILQFLVGKTTTTLDDRILHAIRPFLPIIAIVSSLWISTDTVLPEFKLGNLGIAEIYILAMLAIVAFLLSAIADAVLIWYGIEIRPNKRVVKEDEVFPFVRNVIKIGFIVVFLVFILQRLGFDTTAIITGLGVGGLAVALALQDTLGNFFGGVHILVDKPFSEEDYIKIDNGVEGVVKQIGWRTTKINTYPSNNIILIPNSKIANAVLENFSYPTEKTGITQSIGVDYKENVDSVEKIIEEALVKASEKNIAIDKDSIWVRFDNFGDFSLNFKYGYLVKDWISRGNSQRSVNKEIFYAFKHHNINIPFPVRTVYNVNQSQTTKKSKKKENDNKQIVN